MTSDSLSSPRVPGRAALLRRGLLLEYVTLGWNVVGTVVVFVAGIAAGSVALVGFGLDSAIEILASTVVIWQLATPSAVGSGPRCSRWESPSARWPSTSPCRRS